MDSGAVSKPFDKLDNVSACDTLLLLQRIANRIQEKEGKLTQLSDLEKRIQHSRAFDHEDRAYIEKNITALRDELGGLKDTLHNGQLLYNNSIKQLHGILRSRKDLLDAAQNTTDVLRSHPDLLRFFAHKQADLTRVLSQMEQKILVNCQRCGESPEIIPAKRPASPKPRKTNSNAKQEEHRHTHRPDDQSSAVRCFTGDRNLVDRLSSSPESSPFERTSPDPCGSNGCLFDLREIETDPETDPEDIQETAQRSVPQFSVPQTTPKVPFTISDPESPTSLIMHQLPSEVESQQNTPYSDDEEHIALRLTPVLCVTDFE